MRGQKEAKKEKEKEEKEEKKKGRKILHTVGPIKGSTRDPSKPKKITSSAESCTVVLAPLMTVISILHS